MVNKIILIGRLGKDPELRYAASGIPIANLRIAMGESYTDRDGNKVERTEWHTVVAFQRQAENCNTYLRKGSLVFVEGSLQNRKWQDLQGRDRYTTEIIANRVQFLGRRSEAENRPMEEEAPPKPGNKQHNGGLGTASEARKIDDPLDLDIPSDEVPDLPF
ncbi:MAG: single-stranded DNA-binding protein [Holophagaceae bacterium]|nr:single-stranded DNA-binding protein [Holophagaceae bacterium]